MSIREEARQEAERLWPVEVKTTVAWASRRIGFEAGAAWAREQDTREPSDAEIRAGAFMIDEGAMDSPADYPLQAEAAISLARDVLLAAQGVRRG